MDARGKFIVIEGSDGSGKTVQFERLVLALPEGTKVATLDFPQYGETSSYFVRKYLTGKYGGTVTPQAAAVLYATDRFDAKLKILQWLEDGRTIIANHYVASNMAQQGEKMASKNEREEFYKWLYDFEYGTFGVPKPDLNIILRAAGDAVYSEIAALFPNDFHVIECAENGAILTPEKIHAKVWTVVQKVLDK